LRRSRAFNTTPAMWLDMQRTFSLWCAEHESTGWEKVVPVPMETANNTTVEA
jgi:plasmid maintenance system antidote protein VapI